MSPLIPPAELEPTSADMARARSTFARRTSHDSALIALSIATCHLEDLASALATGDEVAAAACMRAMLADRRAYEAWDAAHQAVTSS